MQLQVVFVSTNPGGEIKLLQVAGIRAGGEGWGMGVEGGVEGGKEGRGTDT